MASSSSSPKKFEWICIIPDKPLMQEKRLKIRSTHFKNLGAMRESGLIQTGGALLHDMPQGDDPSTWNFAGSTLVCVASSREEVVEILRRDIYVQEGVWDVDKAQIFAYKCAFRNPL